MKRILFSLALIIGVMGLFAIVPQVAATSAMQQGVEDIAPAGLPLDLVASFKQITNTILYIVGIIAVIMLIIGGIKYVISGGDSKKVTDAKNTVLYAIIGLVIAFLSWAIVNFVIQALPSSEKDKTDETALIVEAA